jgi:chromosome segregation ATPase
MPSLDWPTILESVGSAAGFVSVAAWWVCRAIDRLQAENVTLREKIEGAAAEQADKFGGSLERLQEAIVRHARHEPECAEARREIDQLTTRLATHEHGEVTNGESMAHLDERMRGLLAQMTTASGKLDLCVEGLAAVRAKVESIGGYIENVDASLQRHRDNLELHRHG